MTGHEGSSDSRARRRGAALAGRSATALAAAVMLLVGGCGGRTARGDAVGIAECDDYVARMQACSARDPRIKAMEPAFRAQRDAWKQTAKRDPATVASNCKAALASLAAMAECR